MESRIRREVSVRFGRESDGSFRLSFLLPHDSVVFLGGREHSTIKELAEVLGKETISMYTDSRTRGQSPSYGQNLQRLGKELMTMDELTTMPGDRCILQLRGLRPFYSPKYDLKKHPNYGQTAEADKKRNAFSADKLFITFQLKCRQFDLQIF